MNGYRIIDKADWPRRDLFEFFHKFDNPCFNISVQLEAANLHACAKDRKTSFFLLALYAILRAANTVPQMRQRIVAGNIVEFERIAVMTPIMTEQELFRQIWCEYTPTFAAFAQENVPKVATAQRDAPVPMEDRGEDFLCASCLPWLHFTSISQAEYNFGQAVPILAWGKMKNGSIPISAKFHHGFVDGLHVGRFFAEMEQSFADPESLWRPLHIEANRAGG
ncbi:MAG: CatA-like O-acetyltransferase [Desulfobulbus sp.]|uniref:CatA-like O-acetyltransferase, family 1 n=1 Tax=Desulfobulbus sp. TaxID=895 RepID=UPI0028463B3B|nr:CatA-like O-acetyltransferase, family 1 [Desulfobulbus sp.]MDR2550661.1 CatA-like O-acetyltransferase [Desulfobulbus sp.]